jgi:predicted nucleotidyltransferase
VTTLMSDEELTEHATRARGRARAALEALAAVGVDAMIVGSLAKGRFHEGSDIDFLVTRCPEHLRYRIEGIVEDALGEFRSDVVYLDEIADRRLLRFIDGAIGASDLR